MKTAAVHSRIEPQLKRKAERILHKLGITPTEAVRMFYNQIALHGGLPFPLRVPNELTEKTLRRSREGKNLEHLQNLDALYKSWDE